MSLVDRCWDCDELVTRCRCDANPDPARRPNGDQRLHLSPAEAAAQDANHRRFLERGWL